MDFMFEERFSLEGRRAVVTGGGGGFGRAFCLLLAEAGAQVVVVDIDEQSAEETALLVADVGAVSSVIACDVSDAGAVDAMTAEITAADGTLNILVNNAGISTPSRRVADIPVSEWDDVIAVNLRSAFLCSRALIPLMLGADGASIVNIASILGVRGMAPDIIAQAGYAASKAGMIGLTLQTAADYGADGLRANAIAPGWHDTKLGPRAGNFTTGEQQADHQQRISQRTPLRRTASADELAPLVLYLASDASGFITGQVISHDGGWTAL
jgi:NAD(P)-dependent dehydrogenase (short-subunit alcohol dehydrogenase family)